MRRILYILILILSLSSCKNSDPKEQAGHLTGYWEITKVELAKDSVMNYGMSQYVDYIELKDSTGFRKKLQPKLGGGYISMNKAEKVVTRIKDGKLVLHYSTPFDEWQEEVISATEEELIVKNEDVKIYHYRKYEPITIEKDEEETEE